MSTRCLTRFFGEDGKPFLTMYRHCDGYPEGHGKELKSWLKEIRITNGIGAANGATANGMHCLAAQAVIHFKGDKVGHIYLYGPDAKDMGEEYLYEVRQQGQHATASCTEIRS